MVYSGGVQGIGDLEILAREGFRGVVVGKAFYEGLIDPKDLVSLER